MKIIAIDTATDVCGISYLIDRDIIHTIEDNIPRQHAKSLPLFYEKLCSETQLTLNNIDDTDAVVTVESLGLQFFDMRDLCKLIPK